MDILGLMIIATAIIILIYSMIFRKSVIAKYDEKYLIINEKKFLRLQLYCSLLNSASMIIFGIIVIVFNLPGVYVVPYPLLFHLINYMIAPIGRAKQYIKYK